MTKEFGVQQSRVINLVLKLDLDMVKMYHHAKNEVSMSRHSKVTARTDRQTDKTQRHYENFTFPHTQAVTTNNVHSILQQHCTSPSPSMWSEATELPELPELKLDVNLVELDLSEAIMEAEATGSQMPVIKNELKYKIQKKRRESGLDELKVEYKESQPEIVSINKESHTKKR